MHSILIRQAGQNDLAWVKGLLEKNDLPTAGVDDWYGNFVVGVDANGLRVGVAGCELYGHAALLRSVAVEEKCRNAEYGRAMVEAVLKNAKQRHVDSVYLFTDGAEGYFKQLGFEVVEREQMDAGVKTSREFTESCITCTAMHKAL